MIKIYALVSNQLILYVGQTINLKQRESHHKCKQTSCSSRHIPDYIDWTIKLLEEVPNDQGTIKEQYYFDTLKPLYNHVRPGQTNDEWRKTIKGQLSVEKSIKHNNLPENRKKRDTKYNISDKRKDVLHKYNTSDKKKEASKRYYLKKKSQQDQND